MAAFASCRRSGWVRLLVVILCALFIFVTLAVPPAQALGVESVAVFGLASVLSAVTAALGFKLSSNEQGQATLQRMVQDFKTVAWATGFVLVGSKLNGLQNGMDYIKMQVKNGKTYLDARVFAWVQQWLAENGVYNSGSLSQNFPISENKISIDFSEMQFSSPTVDFDSAFNSLALKPSVISRIKNNSDDFDKLRNLWNTQPTIMCSDVQGEGNFSAYFWIAGNSGGASVSDTSKSTVNFEAYFDGGSALFVSNYLLTWSYGGLYYKYNGNVVCVANFLLTETNSNLTGLSGTDTLGKDVVDLTLDQVLQKLKEWAQDWFDAGADSATNAATGAQDLPLTVATGAATANPSIAEDGPLVWFPPFSVPIPNLRTGETDTKTVEQGKENASAAETSTVDVAQNQTVIDSLVNWALSYISPDTGLFSKFPLCVPYDAYLLVTSSLGVDAVGSDSIFGASPGDLEGVVSQDIETYSDFQPIINIKHDFQLDGATYPIELTIDLTPWQPLVTFFREGMALLLVAELIGAEFKRIRGH